jgi:hypothetical protein
MEHNPLKRLVKNFVACFGTRSSITAFAGACNVTAVYVTESCFFHACNPVSFMPVTTDGGSRGCDVFCILCKIPENVLGETLQGITGIVKISVLWDLDFYFLLFSTFRRHSFETSATNHTKQHGVISLKT